MARNATTADVQLVWRGPDDLRPMLRPIGGLRDDPANVNTHGERSISSIAASYARFGQQKPVVVDATGMVRAGNGQLAAARRLGWTHLAVVRSDLAGVDIKAYAVADNRTPQFAAFDDEALLAQLREFEDAGYDLAPVGYNDEDVRDLMARIHEAGDHGPRTPAGADVPDPAPSRVDELRAKWQTAAGQVWAIPSRTAAGSAHRLTCGDSTTPDTWDRLMDGRRAMLLVTSPPYNQGIDKFKPSGMMRESDWVSKVARLAYADSLPEDEYQDQQRHALIVWYEVMSDGSSVFYNHKNRYRDKQVVSPLAWLPGPFKLRQEIVWSRPGSVTQNARMFIPSDERIYWLYKGNDFYFDDSTENKSFSTVWDIGLESHRDHAVAFPTELAARPIRACSRPGDIVIEPYLGSGTTMVACEQLGRSCYGCELDPGNVAVTLERLEDMGLTPRLT